MGTLSFGERFAQLAGRSKQEAQGLRRRQALHSQADSINVALAPLKVGYLLVQFPGFGPKSVDLALGASADLQVRLRHQAQSLKVAGPHQHAVQGQGALVPQRLLGGIRALEVAELATQVGHSYLVAALYQAGHRVGRRLRMSWPSSVGAHDLDAVDAAFALQGLVDAKGLLFFLRVPQQDGFHVLGQVGFDRWLPFGIGHLHQVTDRGGMQSVVRELMHQSGRRFTDLRAVGVGTLHAQFDHRDPLCGNPELLLDDVVLLVQVGTSGLQRFSKVLDDLPQRSLVDPALLPRERAKLLCGLRKRGLPLGQQVVGTGVLEQLPEAAHLCLQHFFLASGFCLRLRQILLGARVLGMVRMGLLQARQLTHVAGPGL